MRKFVATLLVAPLLAASAPAMAAGLPNGAPRAAVGLGAVQVLWAAAPAEAAAPAGAAAAPAATTTTPPPGETETFEALVAQASEKFKEKDYIGAVALFERAYQVQNEPAILFNIGRIYEEAEKLEEAIGYYEKFIADDSVDIKDREKAITRRNLLKTLVEIREKEKQKAAPQPKPPETTTPAKTNPPLQTDGPPPTRPNNSKRLLRPVGYAMFGTGALLVIGGAIAGGLARGQYKAAQSAETLDDREAANQLGRSRAITADVLFATGAIFAAAGVVLLVIPAITKARDSKAVRAARSLSPHVSPTQVGIGFTHRF